MRYKNLNFTFHDMGGSRERTNWKDYISRQKVHASMFVLDGTVKDEATLFETRKILKKYLKRVMEHNGKLPLLIYANKMDKEAYSKDKLEQLYHFEKMEKYTSDFAVYSCSALTGEGLQDGIEWLYTRLVTM